MGADDVSNIFNDSPWPEPGDLNCAQLLFITVVYAVILFKSSGLLADGSEYLLLVPSVAGLVGSIVLPILGAVPDGMMTLASGLGPGAQDQVSSGVGVMAGSTVMLLTFPWFIAVFCGRVPIVGGVAKYSSTAAKPHLGMFDSGITYDRSIKKNAAIMLATTLIYLVIQVPAWQQEEITQPLMEGNATSQDQALQEEQANENTFALIGMLAATGAFILYLVLCYLDSVEDKVLTQVIAGVQNNTISFGAALDFVFDGGEEKTEPLAKNPKLQKLMKPFFAKYDRDHSGTLSREEFNAVLRDLDLLAPTNAGDELWIEFNKDGDASLDFTEFSQGLTKYLSNKENRDKIQEARKTQAAIPAYDIDDDDEEEELPEDLADLPPDQQQKAIIMRASWMMALGTVVVVLVSDPFVDLLTEWGNRLGIDGFFVAFVVAPFASNASELLSAKQYAQKKNKKSLTTSISTLIGAACMNNTFCLAIFFGLIYFKQLAWRFTAETVSIMIIQWMIGFLAMAKQTQTMFDGYIILLCYPLCLFICWALKNIYGWD